MFLRSSVRTVWIHRWQAKNPKNRGMMTFIHIILGPFRRRILFLANLQYRWQQSKEQSDIVKKLILSQECSKVTE